MNKILIVAEHLDGKLNSSTARCVSCAKELQADAIDVLVLAADPAAVAADAAKIDGVSKVLAVARTENAHPLASAYAPQIAAAAKNGARGPKTPNSPPTAGPMMKPMPKAAPNKAKFCARFSGGLTSAMYA